jgi:flagellar assembly factor FliW
MFGGLFVMQLSTKHFGMIDVEEDGIIDFKDGIPGFEGTKRYVLLGNEDESSIFRWLQSVDEPELAFALIDTMAVKTDYEIDVDENEIEELGIKEINKVLVYSIVVVPEDLRKISANLKAPVIINLENKCGKQVILDKNDYPIRYYIMEDIQRTGGRA